MKCSGQQLFTPLYLKLNDAMPWPEEEKAFYLLSSQGLYLCRNTPFFRSCVPVEDFPSELAGQKPFLRLSYPRIPRRLLEQVIGFFDIIGDRHGSEAAVLLAWNRTTEAMELIVPEQVGLVGTSWSGHPYPLELEYEVPPLPAHLVLLGDIHSHVDGSAYASYMDKSDEAHRPGLHLVVGRILDEPPQFHCEAIADGFRFKVRDLSLVVEGYHRRRVKEVPPEWLSKVTVKPWTNRHRYDTGYNTGSLSSSPAASSQGTGGYMQPARYEDPEATALRPQNKTADPPGSSAPSGSLREPLRDDATETSSTPPAKGDFAPIPPSAKPPDSSPAP